MRDVTNAWGEPEEGLARVVDRLGARVVGIGGAPGAGKSTLAHEVADKLGNALVVSLDDYYLSKAERRSRGLAWRGPPGSHDVDAFVDLLDGIREGRAPITVARFSAEIDDRIEPVVVDRVPDVAIVEGMLLGHRGNGYEAILDRLDLFVFLSVRRPLARERRFEREAALRDHGGGFSEEEMQAFWDEVLAPTIDRIIPSARDEADIVLEIDEHGLRSATTTSDTVSRVLS